MFCILFSNIFFWVFRGYLKGTFSGIWEHNIFFVVVVINFIFDFWLKKLLKPCVNGVLKFQFFFLNLSSKFPDGVRVRTSKYPYMDICALPTLHSIKFYLCPLSSSCWPWAQETPGNNNRLFTKWHLWILSPTQ